MNVYFISNGVKVRVELAEVRRVVPLLVRKILRIYKLEIDECCYFLRRLQWLNEYTYVCVKRLSSLCAFITRSKRNLESVVITTQ